MKKVIEKQFKFVVGMFVCAVIISFFNNKYAAFFLFGGAAACLFLQFFDLLKIKKLNKK